MSDVPALRLGWWLSSEEHSPRELVHHAATAERIGVTTAMISDHLQPWVRRQGNASHVWTVIGAIAAVTDRLEVGTGVVAMVHRRHPIEVAQAAATAAVLLEDRFFLGLGSGERLNEQPFGERWPRAGERRDQLGEAIEVLRSLWGDSNVNHRGPSWNVENLRLMTLPAAPPPIYVAASGKRSAQLAGEQGDGLIGVEADPRIVDVFHGTGGRGKRCLGQLHVSLAPTIDAARANAYEWWPNGVVPPSVLSELSRPSEFEVVAAAVGDGGIDHAVVCATSADPVVAAIDHFVGAGFDTVYLHQIGPDQQRLADLLQTELLPHYRASGGA